jgi:hypothetical protein
VSHQSDPPYTLQQDPVSDWLNGAYFRVVEEYASASISSEANDK